MTSSTLSRPDTPTSPCTDGCAHVALELCAPGTPLDGLAKVVTMLRGRRWDVRAVDADLGSGTVRLTVRTDRPDLLARQLERVAAVGSVRLSCGSAPARPAG